jgi:hypothetical protein
LGIYPQFHAFKGTFFPRSKVDLGGRRLIYVEFEGFESDKGIINYLKLREANYGKKEEDR